MQKFHYISLIHYEDRTINCITNKKNKQTNKQTSKQIKTKNKKLKKTKKKNTQKRKGVKKY